MEYKMMFIRFLNSIQSIHAMGVMKLKLKDGSEVSIEPVTLGIREAGIGKITDKMDDILKIIPSIASSFVDAINNMDNKPSSLSTEFGISISGEGGIIIAKVGAEAHFKVSLRWEFEK